jgi:hypothetical protein
MKQKFYAMCQFILSNLQKPNDTMQHIIKKHGFIKHDKELDREKLFKYMAQKFDKYKFKTYPSNTLLILDDFAGHPLIAKETSPLARIFTKTRHYNLTVIVVCQSWRFVNRNLKRLCTDIVIWKGFSEEDFKNMILQTPTSQDWRSLYEQYKALPDQHASIEIHITANEIQFNAE